MISLSLEGEANRLKKYVDYVAVYYLINFVEAYRRGDGSASELKETLLGRIRFATDDDKYEILKTFNHFTKYAPCKK
jgi:hypothetical protein